MYDWNRTNFSGLTTPVPTPGSCGALLRSRPQEPPAKLVMRTNLIAGLGKVEGRGRVHFSHDVGSKDSITTPTL